MINIIKQGYFLRFAVFALWVALGAGFFPVMAHAEKIEDSAAAEIEGMEPKLPLPRFVSLRVDEVNIRTGPGERYPIEWVLKRKHLPVEITAEFETWRRIKTREGDEGWVHQAMLSGRRTVLVTPEKTLLRSKPENDARPVAEVRKNAMGALDKCMSGWCRVNFGRYGGWLQRSALWGVYPDEEIK